MEPLRIGTYDLRVSDNDLERISSMEKKRIGCLSLGSILQFCGAILPFLSIFGLDLTLDREGREVSYDPQIFEFLIFPVNVVPR